MWVHKLCNANLNKKQNVWKVVKRKNVCARKYPLFTVVFYVRYFETSGKSWFWSWYVLANTPGGVKRSAGQGSLMKILYLHPGFASTARMFQNLIISQNFHFLHKAYLLDKNSSLKGKTYNIKMNMYIQNFFHGVKFSFSNEHFHSNKFLLMV